MSCNVQNIKIEPVDASWQIEEMTIVKTIADVASALQNKYFFIYSGTNVKHHVWMNVGGAGVDPAPSGSTPIVAAFAANASAATIAAAISSAVDASAAFVSTVSGDEVKIFAAVAGDADDSVDFNTGFTLTKCQDGGSFDLGYLDGDVESTFEQRTTEIMAHQTSDALLAEIRKSNFVEIKLTMKESDAAKLKEIFAKSGGGTYTPGGGTELWGWGDSRQGTNTVVQARRLILHPVRLAAGTYNEDICFWKAYPMPESLVFSGENPEICAITFKCYLDTEKPSGINLFAVGDWTQLVPIE